MPPKPSEKRMQHFREMLAYDQAHLGFGASLAGMDEVGRGPLVGDVVTACVILPAEPVFPWVDDSKKLSATRREEVYAQIMEHALYVGIGRASAREIDEMNILNATRLAMERAAQDASATLCIVDAVRGLHLPFPVIPIIRGDATSYHVAAASIVPRSLGIDRWRNTRSSTRSMASIIIWGTVRPNISTHCAVSAQRRNTGTVLFVNSWRKAKNEKNAGTAAFFAGGSGSPLGNRRRKSAVQRRV